MKLVRSLSTDEIRQSHVGNGTEFDLWLVTERNRVAKLAIDKERKRIKEIISEQTVHYGKTHYEGSDCAVCRINLEIDGEDE